MPIWPRAICMRRSFLTFCVIHLECYVCCAHKRTLARFFSFIAYRIAKIRFTISFECMLWYGMVCMWSAFVGSSRFYFIFSSSFFVVADCLSCLSIQKLKDKKNTSPTTTATSEEEWRKNEDVWKWCHNW